MLSGATRLGMTRRLVGVAQYSGYGSCGAHLPLADRPERLRRHLFPRECCNWRGPTSQQTARTEFISGSLLVLRRRRL